MRGEIKVKVDMLFGRRMASISLIFMLMLNSLSPGNRP